MKHACYKYLLKQFRKIIFWVHIKGRCYVLSLLVIKGELTKRQLSTKIHIIKCPSLSLKIFRISQRPSRKFIMTKRFSVGNIRQDATPQSCVIKLVKNDFINFCSLYFAWAHSVFWVKIFFVAHMLQWLS